MIYKHKVVFRDSMKWLPGYLRSLGESLCPELGAKGDVDHSTVCMSNLDSRKEELVNYMKQDIYMLGGIMHKAQQIYLKYFYVYITSKITLSSLALAIYRLHFDNDVHTPIAIPHRTADEFIRRGYYLWWTRRCLFT